MFIWEVISVKSGTSPPLVIAMIESIEWWSKMSIASAVIEIIDWWLKMSIAVVEIIDCWLRIVAMVLKAIEYQDWRLLRLEKRLVSENWGSWTSTIHLRRPWTSAVFRLASGTVGFSPRLKNSGHVITFLRRCGLQNTDHLMPFWLWTACLIFPPLGRKDVLCTI